MHHYRYPFHPPMEAANVQGQPLEVTGMMIYYQKKTKGSIFLFFYNNCDA